MADTTEGAHGAEAATEAAGMPQLEFSTFPNQIFWLVVTLVVIYWVLSRIALPRIASVLAERRGAITGDISAAEELRNKAAEAEADYERALAEARAEANRIVEEARAEIRAELDVELERADAEIAAQTAESEAAIAEIRAGALESVKVVAGDTAKEIVAALGIKADARTVTAAVNARMKE